MAQVMPADNPFLQFPFGPIQMECDACDLVVEGEIPADLNGSLYRNGPNQRFNPRSEYHLFAGDGMVHAFHINDGTTAGYAPLNLISKTGRVARCSMP